MNHIYYMKDLSLDLQDRRVRLAELLLGVDEQAMINVLEKLVASLGIQRPKAVLSQAELLDRLDEAMLDSQEGRTISANDLLREMDSWK